jgi:nitrogen fixation/metabolism regulation signal transduction histidine kinase
MKQSSIFRPIQILIAGSLSLVVVVILLSTWLTWREQTILNKAREDLRTQAAFQEAHHATELLLMAIMMGRRSPSTVNDLEQSVARLVNLCPPLHDQVRPRIEAFQEHVRSASMDDPETLLVSLSMLGEIDRMEDAREDALLASIRRQADAQLQYELAAPVALLVVLVMLAPLARKRVVKPLEEFGRQMNDLAEGDFTPTRLDSVSEHTLPLHQNFLKLALRLQELERSHKQREDSLKDEVRAATRALLEQQRSLASAERLAATGELAASVAHELRNPLAGIQMSLTNLQAEHDDPDVVERLRLVIAEVERIAQLVNDLVAQSRHAPESPSRVEIAQLVDELLALTRYQLSPSIALTSHVESELHARLPKERLRQAILNLVLNSSKAIGDAEGHIDITARAEGGDLRLEVTDDGSGFPVELRENGIRPFYSTRERGTGLGLAMVRRFVRDTEGTIELENGDAEGRRPGARVTLLLPSAVDHG